MLVTSDFAVDGMPRSGTTWLDRYVKTTFPRVVRVAPKHTPFWALSKYIRPGGAVAERPGLFAPLPDLLRGRRFVAPLRDPLAWYRSWYVYAMTVGQPSGMPERLKVYGDGSLAFRDVLRGATLLARHRTPSSPFVILDPPARLEVATDDLRNAACAWSGGLWSFTAAWLYGDQDGWRERSLADVDLLVDDFLPTGQMSRQVADVFGRPAPDAQPVNMAPRGDLDVSVTPEMLEWIEESDGAPARLLGAWVEPGRRGQPDPV